MLRKKHNKSVPEDQKIVDLFLDSGAFSADTQGVTISLEEYAEFIMKYEKYISVYANLDVIGDAKASYENQLKLEAMGLKPMPVFHANEPDSYLDMYLEKYDYIGLGGTARAGSKARDAFFDRCFEKICNTKDRLPKAKIHGFGLTSIRHMLRYPWYSVDSTSWVLTGRTGFIFVPHNKNGKWLYDQASLKVGVSFRSPSKKEVDQHITTLPKYTQQVILEYITQKGYKLGKSEVKTISGEYDLLENERWMDKKPKERGAKREVEIIVEPGLCNIHQQRDQINIMFFKDLEDSIQKWPWSYIPKEQVLRLDQLL